MPGLPPTLLVLWQFFVAVARLRLRLTVVAYLLLGAVPLVVVVKRSMGLLSVQSK